MRCQKENLCYYACAQAKIRVWKKFASKGETVFLHVAQSLDRYRENACTYDKTASGQAHYNYFRDYDPKTGRYIESDPIGVFAGVNTYSYALNDPIAQIASLGLANGPGIIPLLKPLSPIKPGPVKICFRPIDISWLPGSVGSILPSHHWMKTPTSEAGMGGQCPVPGQRCSDKPYLDTVVKDHKGQSSQPGAKCEDVGPDVDVECVQRHIQQGTQTGTWSLRNNCTTFAYDVITKCFF